MDEIKEGAGLHRYFRTIPYSKLVIDKGDVFFRGRYDEIMNYFKLLLTRSEDSGLLSDLKLKGALIVTVPEGTDFVDYIKLIAKNYYLNIIEFDFVQIIKDIPNFLAYFMNSFANLIKNKKKVEEIVGNDLLKEKGKDKSNKVINIVLINEKKIFLKLLEDRSILQQFIYLEIKGEKNTSLIENGVILVWINHDRQILMENSMDVFKKFDLYLKIPILSDIERETYLKDFLEKNKEITFHLEQVVEKTRNWEIKEIGHLLRMAILKHQLRDEVNKTSNEITDLIFSLIDSGEVFPSNILKLEKEKIKSIEPLTPARELKEISEGIREDSTSRKNIISLLKEIQEKRYPDFLSDQLYEEAASKNYNELTIIIDKLKKNEPLEENARKILVKYPIVLNDTPNIAQINLEKAKKRIDLLKQAFGK